LRTVSDMPAGYRDHEGEGGEEKGAVKRTGGRTRTFSAWSPVCDASTPRPCPCRPSSVSRQRVSTSIGTSPNTSSYTSQSSGSGV